MLKKEITFEDFEGNKVTQNFYFNITRAEAIEMDASAAGGLQNYAKAISEKKNPARVIGLIKDLILKSYGEKSDDGMRFMKSPEISAAFAATDAYSVLFTELLTNTQSLIDFFVGIAPTDSKAKIKEEAKRLPKVEELIEEVKNDEGNNNT